MRLDGSHRAGTQLIRKEKNCGGTTGLLERKDNLLRIKMMKAVLKSWRLSLLLPQNSSVMPGKLYTDEQQLSMAPAEASFAEHCNQNPWQLCFDKLGPSCLLTVLSRIYQPPISQRHAIFSDYEAHISLW